MHESEPICHMSGTLAGDGRVAIVAVLLVSFAGLCGTFEVLGPGGVAVFFASGAPVLILLLAWWRLGDGVTLGFLASMYLHSTLLSVFLSAFTELLMTPLWTRSFPDCQLGFTAAHAISPRTEHCEFLGFAAWLCIPGMIEETFKAVWFFFRLRRSVDDVPETCCCGMFFSQSSGDCGWWFKLAPTPQHVLLAAVAAGAGFEAVENLEYGLAMASTEANMALPVVIIRVYYSSTTLPLLYHYCAAVPRRRRLPPLPPPRLLPLLLLATTTILLLLSTAAATPTLTPTPTTTTTTTPPTTTTATTTTTTTAPPSSSFSSSYYC